MSNGRGGTAALLCCGRFTHRVVRLARSARSAGAARSTWSCAWSTWSCTRSIRPGTRSIRPGTRSTRSTPEARNVRPTLKAPSARSAGSARTTTLATWSAASTTAERLPDGELRFDAVERTPGGIRVLADLARPGALRPSAAGPADSTVEPPT